MNMAYQDNAADNHANNHQVPLSPTIIKNAFEKGIGSLPDFAKMKL
jgi:hypothetical protein